MLYRPLLICFGLLWTVMAQFATPLAAEVIWRGDFETGDLSQWRGAPKSEAIHVVTDIVREGKYAVRIDGSNQARRGERDRIEFQHQPVPPGTAPGTERYFGWSVYLPQQFSADSHFVGYFETRNSWRQVLSFEAKGADLLFTTRVPYARRWQGPGRLTPGRWHDFAVHVRWSRDPQEGFVAMWFDGELVVPQTHTATLLDENVAFFQLGIIRPTSETPETMYIDHIVEATTLAEVTPPPALNTGEQLTDVSKESTPKSTAEPTVVVDLWPGKPVDDVGIEAEERFFALQVRGKAHTVAGQPTKWLTNVSRPTLSVYLPPRETNTGVAMLICPGGGYHNLGWDVEGEEIAAWLNSRGLTGIILKYRCPRRPSDPKGVPPDGPLKDAQRAVSLVRSRAAEWGIDPQKIGMVGFSAGGHLVGATATRFEPRTYAPLDKIDKVSCRPDFGVCCYSGYFKFNEQGDLSPTVRARADAPPLLFIHAADDPISSCDHSITFFTALKNAGARSELHIYATGGHGFGVRDVQQTCTGWTERCLDWLHAEGLLKPKEKD